MSEPIDFIYTNAAGKTTRRRVTATMKSDEIYLRGWCEYSKGFRTFRRDRIQPITDPTSLDALTHPLPSPDLPVSKPKQMQVHFTGFRADDKTRLTQLASQAGMEVRQSVTADLAILVYGYNASQKKLAKAEQQGSLILTEEEFFDLLETGAIPDHQEGEIPSGWMQSPRNPAYYWQIYISGHPCADSLIERCHNKPFIFWKSFTQNTELLVIGDEHRSQAELDKAKADNIAIITATDFEELMVKRGLCPTGIAEIAPHILFRGSGDDGDIVDTSVFFADYAYTVKPAHYPAFNIEHNAERILGRKPRIVLRDCYSLKKRDWLEFAEGDVFYPASGNENEGMQIIVANIDQVEVMMFWRKPDWKAIGYQITPEQLHHWLRTGKAPVDSKRIARSQSRSAIAMYTYTE